MSFNDACIDELIVALLRGDSPLWPRMAAANDASLFIARAKLHGVLSLLSGKLPISWPAAIHEGARRDLIASMFWEAEHRRLANAALEALSACGIAAIIFKGTANAYDVYDTPCVRSRGDTDIIVPFKKFDESGQTLARLGFTRQNSGMGDLLSHQASYAKKAVSGAWHIIDLHRRFEDSEKLASLFPYEQLASASAALPAIGDKARAAGPVDALLIACIHRAKHAYSPYHTNGVSELSYNRLIWLYDIHLLARKLSGSDWDRLVVACKTAGFADVVRRALKQSARDLGTAIPDHVISALALPKGSADRYLSSPSLRRHLMDLQACEGISLKAAYLAQLAFPSKAYMREKYFDAHVRWLPWLYARRAVEGVIERLIHS